LFVTVGKYDKLARGVTTSTGLGQPRTMNISYAQLTK